MVLVMENDGVTVVGIQEGCGDMNDSVFNDDASDFGTER